MTLATAMKHLTDRYQDATEASMDAALGLCARGSVTESEPGTFLVRDGEESYNVQGQVCDCDPLRAEGETEPVCVHVVATELYRLLQDGTPLVKPVPAVTVPIVKRHTLALTSRSIQAIVADLSRPLPDEAVASKTIKQQQIRFLHWQTVARVLDAYAPGWQGTVARIDRVGTDVVITYRLSIPCAEGIISREATGQESEEVEGYGDSSSNSEAMAFKRAAAKFGLGQWLYNKDITGQAITRHLQAETTATWDVLAKAVDAAGQARETVAQWLCHAAGVVRKADVPLGMLKGLVAHLTKEN